jgi:uncharacterized membrane protein
VTRAASALALAVCFLLVFWSLTHHTTPKRSLIVDTPVYELYGDAVADGAVPYRDFRLEYPPAALPVFILPSLGRERDLAAYGRWFDREMALCACLAVVGVVLALRALGATAAHELVALGVVTGAPLLLGPVVLSRFDYWPAALAVLALAALLHERVAAAAVLAGVAIGAKLWPAVLLPFALVWLWRRRGTRSAVAFGGVAVAVVAAIFIPFIALSPAGVWHSVRVQFVRPLQLESLGSAVLITAHHLFGGGLGVGNAYGSQNALSAASGPAAAVTTVLLVLALVAVFVGFVRGEPTGARLVAACAAATAALLAFGKVFSPQFLIWLVPLVPLVPSLVADALLAAALLLTQTWFPRNYWDFANGLYVRESLEVLARDIVVVALFAVLATRVLRRARAARPASAGAAARARPAGAAPRDL